MVRWLRRGALSRLVSSRLVLIVGWSEEGMGWDGMGEGGKGRERKGERISKMPAYDRACGHTCPFCSSFLCSACCVATAYVRLAGLVRRLRE